jgi:hypothetical protein
MVDHRLGPALEDRSDVLEPDIAGPAAAAAVAIVPTVSAVEVTRRYGEGDTAVQALRGV